MNEPRQIIFANMGAFGCYLFCIVHLAEQIMGAAISDYSALLQGKAQGLICPDCYILDPAGLLTMLTGIRWETSKEAPEYIPKLGDYVVLRYSWKEKKDGVVIAEHSHFVLPDWDPFETSQTVKNGSVASRRIFRRAQ